MAFINNSYKPKPIAWQFFSKDEAMGLNKRNKYYYVKCHLCSKRLSYAGGTTAMNKHLNSKHFDNFIVKRALQIKDLIKSKSNEELKEFL